MLFYGAALVACPAVADETTILFNVTIAYILYFYVCLMYNKAIGLICHLTLAMFLHYLVLHKTEKLYVVVFFTVVLVTLKRTVFWWV